MVRLVAMVADEIGAVRRLCGVCESRGYRLRSLSVGPSGLPGILHVELAVDEPPDRAERLARQLRRLIDVISVDAAEPARARPAPPAPAAVAEALRLTT